ncbi:GntR family transcriptional regulator [Planococcus sp. FY231025]|uniref:GntR family transcriptional regulator n=1 Tax=Planococcus sp. FY231025 TaxID=3455699 RepID=UPI003F8FB3F6
MKQIIILPAREQVAEQLRKAIFEEELVKGQELSQEQIAKQLGISRMPVREAFQILEREGLISTKNRKTVVMGMSLEDIADHIDIRALLEGEAAARACMRNADLEKVVAAQKRAKEAVENNDSHEYSAANEEFHKAIWAASESNRLENLIAQLWEGIPPQLPVLVPEQKSISIGEHDEIVAALQEKDAERARVAMSSHLKKVAENIRKRHTNSK